jgi:hypothetical protein
MRYKILFLILFSLSKLQAQKIFQAGMLAGINGCQIHGDSYSGFNQLGAVGGFFVCTNPEKKYYFQMELQYSVKGSRKIPYPERGDFDTFELRMQYAEAPFLIRMNYKHFYFQMGETIGLLTRVREWDDFGEITPLNFRRLESALIVGLGIKISENIIIDLRYTNSLFPIKKFNVPLYYPNSLSNLFNKGMYNNVLGLTACYRIKNKKK